MIVVPFDDTIDEAAYVRAITKHHGHGAKDPGETQVHWIESAGAILLFLALFLVAAALLWWSVQELQAGLSSLDSVSFVRLANGR